MSTLRRAAEREAFSTVEETCPDVDDALAQAAKRIKEECTEPLRAALVEAIEGRMELEDRVAELEGELEAANERIQELESHEQVTA